MGVFAMSKTMAITTQSLNNSAHTIQPYKDCIRIIMSQSDFLLTDMNEAVYM